MVLSADDFIAGWFGGICGTLIGHPIETIKVRQQAFSRTFLEVVTNTYKYEGPRGFFKGIVFPILTIGPANALMFGVYGNIMLWLQHKNGNEKRDHDISFTDSSTITRIFTSATISGLCQTIFLCPSELIKTVLQAQAEGSWFKHYHIPYHGSVDALRGILRDRGIKGFYRGLVPMLLRDVPTAGIYIFTYELLMYNTFNEFEGPVVLKRMWAGGIAGVMSWIFVFPIDVVKNRMQTDDPSRPEYKGMIDCIRKLYKAEGWRVFCKGLPALMIRCFPANAMTFVSYESALSLLHGTS